MQGPPTSRALGQELLGLKTVDDLASFFSTSRQRLNYHLYLHKSSFYREFSIPKRSGGTRLIDAPIAPIIAWQRLIARALYELYKPKKTAHGFIHGKSVATNAKRHVGSRAILNIDIHDFFHSIHFGRVQGTFTSQPFSLPRDVAIALANLCCYKSRLPQGAPTSPVISNLVCRSLDLSLSVYARSRNIVYTRYADDLTFSSRHEVFSNSFINRVGEDGEIFLADELVNIINSSGFELNHGKTRLMMRSSRQVVTGIKVNSKLNVPDKYLRNLRAALHNWDKKGYEAANRVFQSTYDCRSRLGSSPELREHIRGKLGYLKMVRGSEDPVSVRYLLDFARLTGETQLIAGRAANKACLLKQAIWVVLGVDPEGTTLSNGTAVFVEGHGFVTNAHVISRRITSEGYTIDKWVIIKPDKPFETHEITSSKIHEHLDLAVFESATAKPWAFVRRSSSVSSIGDRILLAGYPDWNYDPEPRVETGTVTRKKVVSGRELIQISCTIEKGNSGGPVIGEDGSIVAIATYGEDGAFLQNSCVAIYHLDSLG